jgi:hypothetical protein
MRCALDVHSKKNRGEGYSGTHYLYLDIKNALFLPITQWKNGKKLGYM